MKQSERNRLEEAKWKIIAFVVETAIKARTFENRWEVKGQR